MKPAASWLRAPAEPYPGLRPFLDHEAPLLFGRERQVRELLERLRATQFVVVIGGSGSGKSSLVRAGLTPALRSYGLPGAGDFWLVATTTPGTNPGDGSSTPLTRLARCLATLLRPAPDAAAGTARCESVARVLREEEGLSRVVEAFGDALEVAPGMDPADARLLVVVDQFEELFHPSNREVDDARLLVERVIDHFFAPHPRVHVVLTMRSEHLNDCAGFLELPDAINRSSYLVRRLDEDELREAIVAPAQRFLRLSVRAEPERPWPAEVRFDDAVLARLLHDTGRITHDADHLPLLQHLLARLWQAALAREATLPGAVPLPVPAAITAADLEAAVGAAADPETNVLRASLENQAEARFQTLPPPWRPRFEALLRQLGFKDPVTGHYTQERVGGGDAAATLGFAGDLDAARRALVEHGFVRSVDYLFWDDEDASRPTLKVSHESFIRGWRRFRGVVDAEAARFDELVALLRLADDWRVRGRDEDLLLDRNAVRRTDELALRDGLANPAQREVWSRRLARDPGGAQHVALFDDAGDGGFAAFLAASAERVGQRRRRDRAARRTWALIAAIALVVVPAAAFSLLIQQPVAQRALLYAQAGSLANGAQASARAGGGGWGGREALVPLLKAADLIDSAKHGVGLDLGVSEGLIRTLGWLPPVRRQRELLDSLAGLAEPPVNGGLRTVLGSWLWRVPRPVGEPLPAQPAEARHCRLSRQDELRPDAPPNGTLFTSSEGFRGSERYLFVPRVVEGVDSTVSLRIATFDETGGTCSAEQVVMAIPLAIEPRLVLDATLRYFMVTQSGPQVGVPTVTVHEIEWERADETGNRMAGRRQRAVVPTADLLEAVRLSASVTGATMVPTLRNAGGRVFGFGDGWWWMPSASAQYLRPAPGVPPPPLEPLREAEAGSPCALLAAARGVQPGFGQQAFDLGRHCVVVAMRAAGTAASREVLAAVYVRPTGRLDGMAERLQRDPPAAVAALNDFFRLPAAAPPGEWLVGRRGALAGWLALRWRSPASGREVIVGAPWSTCALARQAGTLLPESAARPDCGDE